MKQPIHLILLCIVLALAGCTPDGTADWEELRNQANELYNDQQFGEALKLYEQALEHAEPDGRLILRQDIIDCHLAMDDDREARRLLADLMAEAHDSGDRQAEAEAAYTLGEQLYEAGDGEKGLAYMQEAVRLMEQEMAETGKADSVMSYHVAMTLAYFHQGLMKWYGEDKAYPQAIAHSKAVERVMLPLGNEPQARKFRRVALATRAYLYMLTDSLGEAETAHRQWQQLLPCLNLTEERDICPYYMESGHYREALEIYGRYEPWILETKGYWSGTEHLVCYNMADIYARTGQLDSAYSRLMQAYEIRDTLYARQSEANAQELEAVYQNQQKTEQIQQQRLWIIVLSAMLAVVVVTIGLSYRTRLVRKRKDKTMAAVIKEMAEPVQSSAAHPDAARFTAFDAAVNKGNLFAKPEVTRGVLVELMGTDSTTFSRIIREQSGCQNLNDYLNRKRIRQACRLLHEHTDWSIDAIARECGFRSVRTFNHVFKSLCGTTPSAYQQQVLGLP